MFIGWTRHSDEKRFIAKENMVVISYDGNSNELDIMLNTGHTFLDVRKPKFGMNADQAIDWLLEERPHVDATTPPDYSESLARAEEIKRQRDLLFRLRDKDSG